MIQTDNSSSEKVSIVQPSGIVDRLLIRGYMHGDIFRFRSVQIVYKWS